MLRVVVLQVPKVQGRTQWTGNYFDWYQATKSETGYA
jgi:hypothetical protein